MSNKLQTKFYDLSDGYTEWSANLLVSDAASELVETMNDWSNPRLWDNPQPLEFLLMGSRTDDPSTEELDELGLDGFYKKYPYGKTWVEVEENNWQDVLLWQSMGLTEYSIMPYPDTVEHRIISPRMKTCLEQFKLSPHAFYPIKVRHEITGEVRDYFLLHFLKKGGGHKMSTYWPMMKIKSFYNLKERDNQGKRKQVVLKQYERGEYQVYDEFIIDYRENLKKWDPDDNLLIYTSVDAYIFTQDWDVFEFEGTVLMNNKVHQAFIREYGEDYGTETKNLKVATGYTPGDPLPEWE